MSNADTKQVAGNHYKLENSACEHWNFVVANDLNYFEGQITKYVTRCRKKGQCIQDLKKARHFLDKYIEIREAAERQMAHEGLGLFPSANEVLGGTPTPYALAQMPKSNDPHVIMSDADRFEAEIGASRRREGGA